MRRTAKRRILLPLILLVAAAAAVTLVTGAAQLPEQAEAVLLTTRAGNAYSVSDPAFVADLLSMTGNAKPALPSGKGGKVCTVEAEGQSVSIVRFGEGYAVDGLLPKKIDAAAFSALAGRLAAAQGAPEELPVLTASYEGSQAGGQEIEPAGVSRSVLGIDGNFYPAKAASAAKSAEPAAALLIPNGAPAVFAFSKAPDRLDAALMIEGEPAECQPTETGISFAGGPGEEFHLTLAAEWESAGWKAAASYEITGRFQPAKSFVFSAQSIDPGEMLIIHAYGFSADEAITLRNPLGAAPVFYPEEGGMVALMPVHYDTKPGSYSLHIAGGGLDETIPLTVQDKKFVTEYFTIDETVAAETKESKAANDEYFATVQPLKSTGDPNIYWEGSFLQPVQGRITSEFGHTRYYNNSAEPERHGGIDLACPLGTPVAAANSGKVLFSEYIALTGNTILIEHGLGLKTMYYHMDSRLVEAGDMVKKGDIIGKVGTTGFSTGPHLHFSALVGSTYINPWTLIAKDPMDGE